MQRANTQTSDALLSRDGFRNLNLGRRRALCLLAYGSGGAAFPLLLAGGMWSPAGLALLGAAAAAYYPLHVFSEGIDYRARHRPDLGREGVDDGIDELQAHLLYNVYRSTRWLLSSAVMAPVVYAMLAAQLGLWTPEGTTEWGLVVAGAAGFVSSLPTVIWCWLEPGTHDLPYPADEDAD